jgi:20S proteasome subunit beta 4
MTFTILQTPGAAYISFFVIFGCDFYVFPFFFFCRYIAKNINLYELSNEGTKLSTHAQANFARGELAAALRRGPYQVNVMLGGYDEKKKHNPASLYYLDYLGALHKVKHGAQGYAQYFCSSIFDKEYSDNLSEAEAIKIIQHCITEMQTRFLISQPNFIIKKVDQDGVNVISFGEDPADT